LIANSVKLHLHQTAIVQRQSSGPPPPAQAGMQLFRIERFRPAFAARSWL